MIPPWVKLSLAHRARLLATTPNRKTHRALARVHRRLASWHRIVLESATDDDAMREASIAEQDARRAAAHWQALADAHQQDSQWKEIN